MALTPDQEAIIRSSLADPAVTNVRNITPAPFEDTMTNRLRSTLGRTLTNPVVTAGIGATAGAPMASNTYTLGRNIAPEGSLPGTRVPTAMVRAEPTPPTQLAPTNANDVTVNAAAPLSLTQPRVGGMGGTSGGAPGEDLRAKWMGDQRAQIGLIGEEAQRTANLGVVKADRVEGDADLSEQHAMRIQEMADIQKKADDDAQAAATSFLDQNKRMTDELAQQKVQPGHLWAEKGAGDRMAFGVAAALSGLASGLTGKPDQFIATWEHAIDRDIAAQEKDIDTKKSALSARQSVFGQFLQQTGDRRLAQQATRNLMLEGLKQQVGAQSARLGIPEVAAQADILTNGIQQKQAGAQAGMDQAAMQWQQQRAAAAAQAAAAARKEAFEQQVKLTELSQKGDEIAIKRAEVEGKNGEKTDKGVQELGKALEDPKLQAGRAVVDRLSNQLAKTPEGEQLPGLGWGSDAVRALPGGAHLLSNAQNVNKQDWEDFKGAIAQQRTGAGGSDATFKKLDDQVEGASTPAERANAIRKAVEFFKNQETAARAGAGVEASRKYDENKRVLSNQLPDSVKVTKPAGGNDWSGLNPSNPWTRK